jgi:ribose transport system ATP-binding protein
MTPRLRMVGIKKRFGATQALDGVSIEVAPGEIHALVGENGAGKSTLMKILSGADLPDAGSIELDGKACFPRDPLHGRHSGIIMIYQELTIAPHLSAEENITLGMEPARCGWISTSTRRTLAREALQTLEHSDIPLTQAIRSLPVAEQQIVEIARALLAEPRVLIMDEPTSSLTRADVQRLFSVIRRLRDRGVSVIYISHFLEECKQIADRYTVLRDGSTVASGAMADASFTALIRMMVGREIGDLYPRREHVFGEPVLELKDLRGEVKPASVSIVLRRGEILGIAGLVGAGRTETLRACFGLDKVSGGQILVLGRESTHGSPALRLAQGIGFVSENRKEEGLMLGLSIAENLTATRTRAFSRWGFLRRGVQAAETTSWMQRLDIKARGPEQAVRELSGGNQQKVAVGRLLCHGASVFLLDEPTRGLDVGSKTQVYSLIADLAARGKGVIVVSSYIPELLGMCDTIGVMCRGTLQAVRPAGEWTEEAILGAAIMAGGEGATGG